MQSANQSRSRRRSTKVHFFDGVTHNLSALIHKFRVFADPNVFYKNFDTDSDYEENKDKLFIAQVNSIIDNANFSAKKYSLDQEKKYYYSRRYYIILSNILVFLAIVMLMLYTQKACTLLFFTSSIFISGVFGYMLTQPIILTYPKYNCQKWNIFSEPEDTLKNPHNIYNWLLVNFFLMMISMVALVLLPTQIVIPALGFMTTFSPKLISIYQNHKYNSENKKYSNDFSEFLDLVLPKHMKDYGLNNRFNYDSDNKKIALKSTSQPKESENLIQSPKPF